MKINELKNKKVLILGFGREGVDTFKFLRIMFPKKTLGIADKNLKFKIKNLKFVRWYLGKNYLKSLKNYNVIIKSPGIPFKILPKSALPKITTQTEIFFDNWPPERGEAGDELNAHLDLHSAFAPFGERRVKSKKISSFPPSLSLRESSVMKANSAGGKLHRQGKIVGITGTKGKSTTSSLIYQILKKGGVKAHLIGNIEKPVLSYLSKAKPEDVYVYELSSHQLYNLKKSPHIAVLLNIYQEHLDYYRNFREYANAKANIAKYQMKEDYLVYNIGNKIVREIAKKSKAKRIPIRGEYYSLDKAAAKAVGKIFKIPSKIIDKTIKNFKPLPHRLELVGTFEGITFYNDALATIPEATIGALDTLGDRVETIMLGGYERNIDFANLAKRILKSNIKTVILFPTTGEKIWKKINQLSKKQSRLPKHFFIDNMREAVKLAYERTGKGKICLLSTASPSFSMFRDYKEKGDLFKKQVRALAKEGGTKVEMKQ